MLSQNQIEKILESAPLVFTGTVKKIGASNLAALEPSSNLVLVDVERVYHAPKAFEAISGTTVTVKIPSRSKLESGESRIFYTKKLMYSENLAVDAVAIDIPDKGHREIISEIRKAVNNMERKEKLSRLKGATLIVEGRIAKLEESKINKNYPVSFRSPFWIEVSIQIQKTLKGKYDGKTVIALINKGGEVEEVTPLEVTVGKTGVWILRLRKIPLLKENLEEYYIIEEPDDFLNSYEYQMLTNPKLL
jgi:hypothetical protein